MAGANATDAGGLQDGREAADHERRKGRPRDVGVGLFGNPDDDHDDHDGQDHRCDDHGGRLQPAPHGDEPWRRLVRLVANVVVFAVERDRPSPPVVELLVRTRARPDHPSNGVPAQILTRNWPDLGAPADPGDGIPGRESGYRERTPVAQPTLSPVSTIPDVIGDWQAEARHRSVDVERPQGSRFRTPNTSLRIRGADLSLRRSAPEVGADLEAVPAEAGVAPDEAAELAAELAAGGAFGSPAVPG